MTQLRTKLKKILSGATFLSFTLLSTASFAGGNIVSDNKEPEYEPLKWNQWAFGNSLLSFHGYHRFSHDWNKDGTNGPGDKRAIFQAPGAGSNYRLGNESNYVGEYFLDYKYYLDGIPGRGGSKNSRYIGLFGGPSGYAETGAYGDIEFCLEIDIDKGCIPQLYATLGNFLGKGVDVWFGRSFYGRRDIHILDRFYTNPGQGADYGGGIKGIPGYGDGHKLDIAAFSLKDTGNNVDGISFDIRYKGIKTGKDGELTLWAKATHRDGNSVVDDKTGFGLGLFHEEKNVYGGRWNNAILYRQGASITQGIFNARSVHESGGWDLDDAYTLELNTDYVFDPAQDWTVQLVGLLRHEDRGTGDSVFWASAGGRAMYFFNKNFNIAFESGLDYVDNDGLNFDASGTMWKNTIALGITDKKGYWNRPIARIYGTYAIWDESLNANGNLFPGGKVHDGDTEGFTFGIQFESWW